MLLPKAQSQSKEMRILKATEHWRCEISTKLFCTGFFRGNALLKDSPAHTQNCNIWWAAP